MKFLQILFLMCLILFSCTAGPSTQSSARCKDPQKLLGRTWQWVSTVTPLEKITVAAPERYTLCSRKTANYGLFLTAIKAAGDIPFPKNGLPRAL